MTKGGRRRPVFALLLLSAMLLSGCGIVATFDRTKLDAGHDAGLDADGAPDAPEDALVDADAD